MEGVAMAWGQARRFYDLTSGRRGEDSLCSALDTCSPDRKSAPVSI
jgi:hypothetical protein